MEEYNFLGIFGEILYYGGTAEGWAFFKKYHPDGSLRDYVEALKLEAKKNKTMEVKK